MDTPEPEIRHMAESTTFRLVTTLPRVIEVEAGEPITALAEGEHIRSVQRSGDEPLSEAEVEWVQTHVAPLMVVANLSL